MTYGTLRTNKNMCALCGELFVPGEEVCPRKDGRYFAHLRCVDELTIYAGAGQWASQNIAQPMIHDDPIDELPADLAATLAAPKPRGGQKR